MGQMAYFSPPLHPTADVPQYLRQMCCILSIDGFIGHKWLVKWHHVARVSFKNLLYVGETPDPHMDGSFPHAVCLASTLPWLWLAPCLPRKARSAYA